MNMKEIFTRSCPSCGDELIYKNIVSFKRAKKNNSLCKSCISKLQWDTPEIKKKMCNEMKKSFKKTWGESSPAKGIKWTEESKKSVSKSRTGRKMSLKHKINTTLGNIKRYKNPKQRQNTSLKAKQQWANPEIRNKMVSNSNWNNVRMDRGQKEFIEKWNNLGFNFEINYQLKDSNSGFLAYLDGYDPIYNIVIEYDGYGHGYLKDLPRQNKIIELLNPKKFWRFNRKTKTIQNVLESV